MLTVLDLDALGRAIRSARQQKSLTIKGLSEECGLSVRFISDVERGQGNISVSKLIQLARALGVRASDWVAILEDELFQVQHVALIGLRGAGKSTVGALVARAKNIEFIELDQWITSTAGLPLSQIFEIHGEAYYRRLERQAMEEIIVQNREPVIVAVSGGIVSNEDNWNYLKRNAKTIWLKAEPEQHYERVRAQGDFRPMQNRPAAMSELRAILAQRTPQYAECEKTIDTSQLTSNEVSQLLIREAYPQ